VLAHCGVIPLAARGYVLLVDAERVAGRRLTEAEHRACRDHIDRGVPLPPGEPFDALQSRARDALGLPIGPSRAASARAASGL